MIGGFSMEANTFAPGTTTLDDLRGQVFGVGTELHGDFMGPESELAGAWSALAAAGLELVPSLAAWGILWLPSPQYQIGSATVLFVAVWSADLYLASRGLIPSWFVDLRTAITAIACVILGVAYFLL